jgi:hypothetical protein
MYGQPKIKITVHSENYSKDINVLCGPNAGLVNVTAGEKYGVI